jgi:uncharacterized protein with ParB-like and HNH nuclease domain
MSKYTNMTIKDAVGKISSGDIYLPAIQRKFVWKHTQIEKLFDSLMREYPIGTFLFWMLNGENINKYTFYKFIQEYHERDSRNEIRPTPELKENIIGVLDGQQRLSSMYIALQGTYAYKKKYVSKSTDSAYPKRRLFLNLMYDGSNEEEYLYEFKFLAADETKTADATHLWFDVRKVLEWGNDPDVDDYYDTLIENAKFEPDVLEKFKNKEAKSQIKKNLRVLHQRIVQEELISYYSITEQDLDKILDIFVRVNSAGTILSKSDLLFSTIIANWEEGREEIEDLIEKINKIGDTFSFDSDFVMRTCLFVIDAPVLFKVESFNKANITKIIDGWDNIKSAIVKAVEVIYSFGFNKDNLTAANAIIPVVYYIYKNGITDKTATEELRKYVVSALLKMIFSSSGEQVLTHLRQAMNTTVFSVGKIFSFDSFATEFHRINNRRLKIQPADIEDILNYKKGPYTFMVLSMLYPNLKFGQIKFHQDHIHPYALFKKSEFDTIGLAPDVAEKWTDMRDKLPNLQLLEGLENISKNKTPLAVWLHDPNGVVSKDLAKYKADNYIDPSTSEDFKDFEEFYNKRSELLIMAIKTAFNI